MKQIKLFLIIVLLCALALFARADEPYTRIYEYYCPEVTVDFSGPLSISEERYTLIADDLAGIQSIINPINSVDPNNIICTLFGHNLSTTSVTVKRHKVRQYSPRCILELYHVNACSRCDYYEKEYMTSSYVVCCPEGED